MTLYALGLLLVGQITVGPLDGFRANYAAIRADLNFEYQCGYIEPAEVSGGKLWSSPTVGFDPFEGRTVVGNWGCDGVSEYYHCGSPDAIIAGDLKIKRKPSDFVNHIPKYEMTYDGTTAAYHNLKTTTLDVQITDRPGLLGPGNGPFIWWGQYPFPMMLDAYMPDKTTTHSRSSRGGHFVEIDVHTNRDSFGSQRIEVAYDPAVGYLPRHERMVIRYYNPDKAYIKEFYLISAEIAGNGFVPMEWYETFFEVERFNEIYSTYDENTVVDPVSKFSIGHFKVTQVNKPVRPVKLRNIAKIRRLSGIGGQVDLAATPKTLGLAEVTAKLGRKMLTPSATILPHLDEAEMNELGNDRGSYRGYLFAGSGAVALLVAGWVYRRRQTQRVILLLLPWGVPAWSGCGPAGHPSPHLAAAFTQTRVIYDANGGGIPLTLVVKNDGNQPINLISANGGCTCRQVDQTSFPTTLRLGATLAIPVKLNDRRNPGPENVVFTFETDHGSLNTPTKLYALAAHQLNPEAPTNNGVREHGDWKFDLVHRQVFAADTGASKTKLEFPDEFSATKVETHTGRVGRANEFAYEDITYQVELVNQELGIRKAGIRLSDPAGKTLVDAPVLWRRLTFLNHVPDHVMLSERPVRVFLRCDDESVELTRVIAESPGIKAVVASPREVSISLADDAAPVIDGLVQVATTATDQPPLDIRVLRYSPPIPVSPQ